MGKKGVWGWFYGKKKVFGVGFMEKRGI